VNRCFASVSSILSVMLFKHSGAVFQLGWSSPTVWYHIVSAGVLFGTICSPIIGAAADQCRSFLPCMIFLDLIELMQSPQVGPSGSAAVARHSEFCVSRHNFFLPVSLRALMRLHVLLELLLSYSVISGTLLFWHSLVFARSSSAAAACMNH
jgi:hypothetical protein